MTDPIADFLIRLKNGYLVKKSNIEVPYSKMKHSLAQILKSTGYLDSVTVTESHHLKHLKLTLRYLDKMPALTHLKRLSKPSRRSYVRASELKPVLSGSGETIISTSQGLMTGKTARQKNLGGEAICEIW